MPIVVPAAVGLAAKTAAASAGLQIGKISVQKLMDYIRHDRSISSLADKTRPARVEPIVIIDEELRNSPMLRPVLNTCTTLFMGYYIQAVSMVMNVGQINVGRTLDTLNPNRSEGSNMSSYKAVFSSEAYSEGLPSLETFEQPLNERLLGEISLEAVEDQATTQSTQQAKNVSTAPESTKKLYEESSLAVGRMFEVELVDGDHSAKLPILIRLVPTYVNSTVLTHIFTAASNQNSWRERFHLWRSGQLSFVRDIVMATDMIDTHRKVLAKDSSNLYETINKRRTNNTAKAVATGKASAADASNIALVTPQKAREMARVLGGKIDSVKVRQKIFDTTYLLLLVIVDDRWERATIYHRGDSLPTEVSLQDMKAAEKGKGPDVSEILSAYRLGNQVSL